MSHLETHETQAETKVLPAYSQAARSNCPDCQASLAVL